MPPPSVPHPRAHSLSIRGLMALVTAAPVVLAVGLTGWLSVQNGERLVQGLVVDLQQEVAAGAERGLRQTLDPPHLLNGLNADLLDGGHIDPNDPDGLQRHFLGQLKRFESAGYVQLGLASGAFVGVERVEDGFRVERTDPALNGKDVWVLDATGVRVGGPIATVPGYQTTRRPWYQSAIAAGGPAWSPIYQFSSRDEARLGITAVQPWLAEDGSVRGVIGTDIVLVQLGKLMASSRLREGGRVFAMERDGVLVAHSRVHPPFVVGDDQKAARLHADDAPDLLTNRVSVALSGLVGGLAGIVEPVTLALPFDGDLAYVLVTPVRDGRGVDWLLVVALPRVDFTPELRRNVQQTALLCLVAALLALALGGWAALQVSKPMLGLAEASRRLAEGKRSSLPTSRIREVTALSAAFATMRDDLVEQREALARTTEEALQAKRDAERASTAKSTFLASMSHELRTPMNAILGYAELLAESETITPQDLKDLGRIRTAGGRLLALISDVLDLSRIEAGKLELDLGAHDVNQLASEAIEMTRVLIEGAGNTLQIHLAPGPAVVRTDGQKVQQCVVNLLSNAAKFTSDGQVVQTVVEEADHVVVAVRDSGRGIPADRLESLFAPFSQVSPTENVHQGTGLGLAITREFSRAVGGDVTVESIEGAGSVFRLFVPKVPTGSLVPAPDRDAP